MVPSRSDREVNRRDAVVSGAGELRLRLQGSRLNPDRDCSLTNQGLGWLP
jgi:hypothetical protein